MLLHPAKHAAASQAADAILALINGKPRSPTKDELAAVITANLTTTAPALPALRRWQDTPQGAEWLALEAEFYKITEEKDLPPDDPGYDRAQAEVDAVRDRVEAFVLRIWETRATTLRDAIHRIGLYGAIAERMSDQVDGLSGEPLVFLDPETLALNDRPAVCDDSAIAHLLDAIRKLEDLWTATREVDMRAATISPPVAPLNAARDNYLASDWHRAITAFHDDWELPENQTDEKRFALHDRLCDATNAIWAKPVRTWGDLIERTAMAVRWNTGKVGDPAYPDDAIASDPSMDVRALAFMVRGILDIAGLAFDNEGRLLAR